LRGVRYSHPHVFGGIIINYLFTPCSTRGRASGTHQNWIFKNKNLEKTNKIVILKKYVLK
jgi:hypothetical protein